MERDWLRAAERYEAAKQPEFKARKSPTPAPKLLSSFASFMAGSEGEAAKKLLAASGQELVLGYSEAVMSRTTAVVFDGEGLKTHSGVVGMAAAYSKEEPVRTPIDAARALDLLRSFPEQGNLLEAGNDPTEESLVENVRLKLDEIAKMAPHGSTPKVTDPGYIGADRHAEV